MKRLIIPAVMAVLAFLSACATDRGAVNDFTSPEEPEETSAGRPGNSGTSSVLILESLPPQASKRRRRTYPWPESYEAAYAYRNDKADIQVARLPQYVSSLRINDPPAYVRQAAAYITRNAKNSFDKVKKIHDFVTLTIRYDADAFLADRKTPQDYASVLKSGLALGDGYANVLKRFCDVLGIECEVIYGYGRGAGFSPFANERPGNTNHAWNIVFIDDAGYLIDCTWDAGNLRDGSFHQGYTTDYLFLRPEYFIYSHFPENPRQQLLEKPLSRADFSRLPLFRPKYFETFSAKDGSLAKILRAAGKTELDFSAKAGFTPNVEVYDETGNNKLEHLAFVQKNRDLYRVLLTFPTPKNYVVKFFIHEQTTRSSEPCAEFGVISTGG
ncbi:MAG: hypothetical protein LBC60_08255 [Spirochaetaceae bacterium]|jgi:predicted small secreted protein|nr:hypothetical protein [Spirochaetaceae bacterium]